MVRLEQIDALRKKIASSGATDRYIDREDELQIYRRGKSLNVEPPVVEALLNQMCRDNQWTLEKDVILDLRDRLEVATRGDHAIDRKRFEQCVNYAVRMNMPRKRAVELSVRYVLEHRLAIKTGLFGGDWFEPFRRQYLRGCD
jgi:hypothetical protein